MVLVRNLQKMALEQRKETQSTFSVDSASTLTKFALGMQTMRGKLLIVGRWKNL